MTDLLFESPLEARATADAACFERDLLKCLASSAKVISPKYLYDATGSAIFDLICSVPEYYPTRTELSILSRHGSEIASLIGEKAEIVEFGAGSLSKIKTILDALGSDRVPACYVPIDVSGEHLERASLKLQSAYPGLSVRPIVGDYTGELHWPHGNLEAQKRIGFFPGSTLGNFDPGEALSFLESAAKLLRGGGLLIGIDLVKDPVLLHAAYNDSQGITAAFNLNLLRRANRELGTNFASDGFAHYAFYNPVRQRIEMHLVSKTTQAIHLAGKRFDFEHGTSIHTESSYKYTVDGFRSLARMAGFQPGPAWVDGEGLFSVHWLHAPA